MTRSKVRVWVERGDRAHLEAAFDWADAQWRAIPGLSTTDDQQAQLDEAYRVIDAAFVERDRDEHVRGLKLFRAAVEGVTDTG